MRHRTAKTTYVTHDQIELKKKKRWNAAYEQISTLTCTTLGNYRY